MQFALPPPLPFQTYHEILLESNTSSHLSSTKDQFFFFVLKTLKKTHDERRWGDTLNDLGLVPEIYGDVLRASGAEGVAEDADLFGGVEDDCRGQIGDADGPIAGAEEHLHQMPGGEAPPAGNHAKLRLRCHRNRLCRRRLPGTGRGCSDEKIPARKYVCCRYETSDICR